MKAGGLKESIIWPKFYGTCATKNFMTAFLMTLTAVGPIPT